MTDGLEVLIIELRKFGSEATRVEVKSAAAGLPTSARESLSAFSNSPGGGTLILGLDDTPGFRPTGLADPRKMLADLAAMCRDDITPPLQPELTIGEVDGNAVVVALVNELPREQKPCYVTKKGINGGTYIRVGDSDRRLTAEEVHQLIVERGQPMFDSEPVPGATSDDFDRNAIEAYISRLREQNPRLWGNEDDETVLRMNRVVVPDASGVLRPSLAGLLSLGHYPQQHFPQLNVTFVHYPTVTGESSPSGVRFLDNVSVNGSIPYMAREALAAIQRNMTRRALITGDGRRDVWEYPPEALREAIVNALVHRDLSPGSRGTQVQIELYPDRLRIQNPGGLFGSLDINRLGEEGRSSARNALLLKLLEEVSIPGEDRTVCENRGSGIRAMISSLRRAGMGPPLFKDKVTSFEVVMPNHALLDDETVLWLSTLGREGIRDSQCIALALMKRGEVLDNAKYRAATGVNDSRVAYFELQDLVARELVDQTGSRGGARYTISEFAKLVGTHEARRKPRPNRRRQILEALAHLGELSKAEIAQVIGASEKATEHWLGRLKRDGDIEVTGGKNRSKNTKYVLNQQLRIDDHDPLG
ncbi:ATP-binding protein [Dactylosporangium sp. NPDC050588]|uniref:ATP-binding protein n=1 Tax=Dactylosporangium sp. NPDC050588 TaxID=3157211 RepID=UPI0033CFCA03